MYEGRHLWVSMGVLLRGWLWRCRRGEAVTAGGSEWSARGESVVSFGSQVDCGVGGSRVVCGSGTGCGWFGACYHLLVDV